MRDLQHRLYARDETINGRGVREGGGEQCCCWHAAHSAALFRSLQPRAKWAVVQQCRPASACRFLLSPRRSGSSAYTQAAVLSRTPHSFAARVYRLVRPRSFTHNTIRARRRPTYRPSPHSHEQIHARQQSTPRALFAHCPQPILGHVSPPSFVPHRKPLLPTKLARPPP